MAAALWGEPMSAIADLDPRRDLGLIRERIEQQLQRGHDPSETVRDLASRNPIALADMVIGPRAPRDPRWIQAALASVDVLEEALPPNGLYRKLVALCPQLQSDILKIAARRHPAAGWLIELSRNIEGQQAGLIHLTASAGHPSFTQNCWAHAAAGHLPGLISLATQTGLPEPAAAIAAHGHIEAAAIAMVRTIECAPDAPVVALVAAAWGPDVVPVLRKTLPHLRSRSSAIALAQQSNGYSDFSTLMNTLIGAMVQP
jgi:hypothetical protein